MKKSQQLSISIDPYLRKTCQFILRNYKYIQNTKPFRDYEEIPKDIAFRFIKKIKKAKLVRKISLQPSCDIQLKPTLIQSVLKTQAKGIKDVDSSTLSYSLSSPYKSCLFSLKNLHTLRVTNNKVHPRSIQAFRALQSLFIDLRCFNTQINRIYSVLTKLRKIKDLKLLLSPTTLKSTMDLLNQFSAQYARHMNIQIATKDDEDYSNKLPRFSSSLSEMIATLRFQYIKAPPVLDTLFSRDIGSFSSLKSLKLEFCVSDLNLVSYLRYLNRMNILEKLSLYFSECWSQEFSESVIKDLQLPTSLTSLKINMSLSLKDLITNKGAFLTDNRHKMTKYPWREYNIFENEPHFASFFQTLKDACNLKEIQFKFQMHESFNSHYTNFFVSMLNRLPNLNSFSVFIVDQVSVLADSPPEHFDLSLILKACSNLNCLEQLEIIAPNLLFEDAKLSSNLTNLKGFGLGISDYNEDQPVRLQDISQYITGFIKTLAYHAPNLNSLIFDFGEVIDGRTFSKRFLLLEKLVNLEFLCMIFYMQECTQDQVKSVGRGLQALKKLDIVSLRFEESDENISQLTTYLNYHKSVREALVRTNEIEWINDDNGPNVQDIEEHQSNLSEDEDDGSLLNISGAGFEEVVE